MSVYAYDGHDRLRECSALTDHDFVLTTESLKSPNRRHLEAPPEQQVIRNYGSENVGLLGELGAGAPGAGVA
jgi:hypothetical protein